MKIDTTLLAAQPFLKGLSKSQLEVLSSNAMEIEFPAGRMVFNEGDAFAAATQRFKTHRSRSGIQIDKGGSFEAILQNVEQRLTNLAGGRSRQFGSGGSSQHGALEPAAGDGEAHCA